MTPEVGTRWKMQAEWRGRPFPQHGTWVYTVVKVEDDWVTVRIASFGEAGIDHAKLQVQAWSVEGYTTPKGHQVWFVPA